MSIHAMKIDPANQDAVNDEHALRSMVIEVKAKKVCINPRTGLCVTLS